MEWSSQIEEELTSLLKDWLKHQGRTQADLRKSLQAMSSRMPALLEVLQREHRIGGLPKLISRLCEIEASWTKAEATVSIHTAKSEQPIDDPFGQLDFLLQEIREDNE